jgi:Na+/H+-dicarboxylate symporter/ABC-type amino acid transport substrate-binding protein
MKEEMAAKGNWFLKLVPRSTAGRCLLAVILGGLTGMGWGEGARALQPLADLFVRVMTLVVLPFMVVEVITCLAGLQSADRDMLLRLGGWILLGLLALAAAMVCLLPQMLPPLLSSPLFDPQILEKPEKPGALFFLIPENIFSALVAGNFAAAAFCSAVIGLVLQKMPGREPILALLRPLRAMGLSILTWVANYVSPLGIFALTATTLGLREAVNVERLIGFGAMMAVALLALGGLILPGCVTGLTGLKAGRWWRILKAPLILVACTGQVFISIPLVFSSLRSEVWNSLPGKGKQQGLEAVEAFVILGFSLFSLGKWVLLVFLPFAAWYYDAPIGVGEILRTLLTAIPASIGGVYLAIVQELPRLGLPVGLGNFYLFSYAWVARCGDVLTLMGTLAGAVVLCAYAKGQLQVRLGRLALWLGGGTLAGFLAGMVVHRSLSEALKDSQGTRQIVMQRVSVVDGPEPMQRTAPPEPAPPTLAGIQARGVLRVGLLEHNVPWAYFNGQGVLVGYDVDLVKALADSMKVRLILVPGTLRQLRLWLEEQRVDLVGGGIPASTILGRVKLQHTGYEQTCLALLVEDRKMGALPGRLQGGTLRLERSQAISVSSELERAVKAQLSPRSGGASMVFLPRPLQDDRPGFHRDADAILTTAEAGSAYAVLHPQYSMVPAFEKKLGMEVGFVTETTDEKFLLFLENWLDTSRNLGLLLRLRRHWLEFR